MGASLGPGIVIVGLGPAAVNALEGIRSQDVDVPVTILSQEPYYAYYRPRLSHLLGEEVSSESLAIKKPQWYEERNAQVLLGQTAKTINVDRKTVSL
ncbi:MAG TPA: NAD(P)/FAD-dependent oxidoreductase, partial [Bacillota bacterium]|nr:NAD(P)/FAD-dependent oxidoreductase [Bacillota bacterium]